MGDQAGITDGGSGEMNGEQVTELDSGNWHRHTVAHEEYDSVTYAHDHPDEPDHDHPPEEHLAQLGRPGDVKGPDADVWGEEHANPPAPADDAVKGPDPDVWGDR